MRYEHIIESGFERWTSGVYTDAQIDALNDFENTFILLSGAYRSGKSELASRLAIRHAMAFPGSRSYIVRQHLTSVKKSTLLTFLSLVAKEWLDDWSNVDLTARFKNGSTVSFLGASDPDKIGSIEASFVFIDEAHELSEESFSMLQGRLSLKLSRPHEYDELTEDIKAYVDGVIENNQIFLACNPKSKGHWLYKHFIEKPKPKHKCYKSNSISNGNLPEQYLLNNLSAYVRDGEKHNVEFLKQAVKDVRAGLKPSDGLFLTNALNTQGQRNLLGLWVAADGLVYDIDERDVFIDRKRYEELTEGMTPKRYGGLDWGFNNPRLVLLEYYEAIDTFITVKYWDVGGQTPDVMLNELERWHFDYDVETWYCPPDQPGLIKKAKKMLGSRAIKKAANSVLSGIDAVSARFSQGKLLILNDSSEGSKLCWEETSGYEWKTSKDGNARDEVVKERDHYPDAIRYAIYSYDRKRRRNRPDPSDSFELYPIGG